MRDTDDIQALEGCDVLDRDGEKIGSVHEIYVDDDTGEPAFALVKSGFLGTSSHFVPISAAGREGGALKVPYEKGLVKDAPGVAADGHLSQDEEAALYRHYGLEYGQSEAEGDPAQTDDAVPEGGAGGPSRSGAEGAMTRSEEELRVVGHETRPRERVRLRKHEVTEYMTMRVPVTREEVRVEREPADAPEDEAGNGGDAGDAVTLTSQEPVVEKQVVPKERVRLEKETVTEPEQVSGTVRKEHVELERGEEGAQPEGG